MKKNKLGLCYSYISTIVRFHCTGQGSRSFVQYSTCFYCARVMSCLRKHLHFAGVIEYERSFRLMQVVESLT